MCSPHSALTHLASSDENFPYSLMNGTVPHPPTKKYREQFRLLVLDKLIFGGALLVVALSYQYLWHLNDLETFQKGQIPCVGLKTKGTQYITLDKCRPMFGIRIRMNSLKSIEASLLKMLW